MKLSRTRLFAVALALCLLMSAVMVPTVSAEQVAGDLDQSTVTTGTSGDVALGEYGKYLASISGYNNATEDIVIDAINYKEANDVIYDEQGGSVISVKSYNIRNGLLDTNTVAKDCLVWGDNTSFQQQGSVTYEITVTKTAIYNIAFKYLPISKTGANLDANDDKNSTSPVVLGIKIDGKTLYTGLENFSLPRIFVNDGATAENPKGEIRQDSIGNELTPEQVEFGEFVTAYATDPVGVVADPYKVLLTEGTHLITLESVHEPFALATISFIAPEEEKTYEQYMAEHSNASVYTGPALEIEGEDAWLKSTNSIVSKSDNGSSDITPNNPVKSLLNYIGNTNWQVPGESITWVIDVPEDGLYTLGFNYKQATIIDGFSYRSLSIDDEIPFAECKNLRFNYNTSWEFVEIGDKDPYKFYLTKGKHTFKLTITLGETAEFYTRLSEIVEVIGDTYIDIVMITGVSPDVNRDYDLFKQIPDFEETLVNSRNDLLKLAEDMKALSGVRSNKYISALNNMARVLLSMYENKFTAQTYLSDYYSNYTTVCSWLYEMKTMPLSVDQFQLASPENGFKDNTAGFWESLGFSFKRFFASFSDDFSTIGGTAATEDAGEITIWVNWGRDQTQVLSNLIQDSFTPETGIGVKLEIVNASLIMGILSGNFPDLSLNLARTGPVNLGMRGALYDLTNFSAAKDPKYSTVDDGSTYLLDYETVLKRFQESADVPYWYEGGLYALPETQSFYIMFYRTDVFENLGIEDPTTANNGQGWTWDDYLKAGTILQRNNMEACIPYTKIATSTTVDAGMGSLSLFPTILTQNNVPLYNDELNATTFTSSEAISAFTTWTDFYTKHGIAKQIDMYNRFRAGTAPLGIATYSLYTQLTQVAPEIQGRWTIAPIPGTMQEDGTINRSIAGAGTGCSVVAPSSNKDQAWQFLCWLTSAKVQLRYNNNVESILGAVSRTLTANVEAFNAYSWNADDLKILNYQWSLVEELPEVPGGYYVSRAVDQAFWQVLNGESNEKDAMLKWGEIANNEILRKIAEYAD